MTMKENYEIPELRVIEMQVESGFAQTGWPDSMIPDNDGNWNDNGTI